MKGEAIPTLSVVALPDYRVIQNKLIGCGEEICGPVAPLTKGMEGHENMQRGGGDLNMIFQH
jgi:hypothetical protein